MTCEISIMNRQALALAADSAITVREWVAGKEQVRYFKGANKIFQLSNFSPVGVMIFGSASIHEVPWELLIKDFRENLSDTSFKNLSDYENALFDFIKKHPLFPKTYQDQIFKEEIYKVAFMYTYLAQGDESVKKASDGEENQKAYQALFEKYYSEAIAKPRSKYFTKADIKKAIARYKRDTETEIRKLLEYLKIEVKIDVSKLAETAIQSLFKEHLQYMSSSGVVIAGFGDHDYFPGYEEYICYGILMGKILFEKTDSKKVDVENPSSIKAFATTAMVSTFLTGISPDVYVQINLEFRKALKALGDKVKEESGGKDFPNLDNQIESIAQEHIKKYVNSALDAHAIPLRRVVGSLPVDEMAELAETLIMLQSLKEKVTQPTESVGGPIDVAVLQEAMVLSG